MMESFSLSDATPIIPPLVVPPPHRTSAALQLKRPPLPVVCPGVPGGCLFCWLGWLSWLGWFCWPPNELLKVVLFWGPLFGRLFVFCVCPCEPPNELLN